MNNNEISLAIVVSLLLIFIVVIALAELGQGDAHIGVTNRDENK